MPAPAQTKTQRKAKAAAPLKPLKVKERYGIVLADPPWKYQNFSSSKNGAASSAISTMHVADIAAIPVKRWCEKDCMLALWATWPKLPEAMHVAAAWGFPFYITAIPWLKTLPRVLDVEGRPRLRTGIGFWSQSVSEVLLLYRRGQVSRKPNRTPVKGLLVGDKATDAIQFYESNSGPASDCPPPQGQLFAPAEERRHSSKPRGIHRWLTDSLPGAPLELFARQERPGWTSWGYDLGYELGSFGVRPCRITDSPRKDCPDPSGSSCPEPVRMGIVPMVKGEDPDQQFLFGATA